MINIDRFLADEQDPKAVEKVAGKLNDLLTTGEEILYLAVQKKPAVNILPDCIAISNKRIFYCSPSNLGLTMNFKDISWKSIHEVAFKEELFGAKFTCTPVQGVPLVTDFIPKVQARKLYQVASEQLELYKEQQLIAAREAQSLKEPAKAPLFQDTEGFEEAVIVDHAELPETTASSQMQTPEAPMPVAQQSPAPAPEPEDETTLKLRKLKTLYDKQLITLEEYEAKKASILDSF